MLRHVVRYMLHYNATLFYVMVLYVMLCNVTLQVTLHNGVTLHYVL